MADEEKPVDPMQEAIEARRKADKTAEYGATAVIKLHLEVQCKSAWAGSATAEEVMRVGGKETVFAVENALQTAGVRFKHVSPADIGLITFHRSKGNG